MLAVPPPQLLWQDRRELHRFLCECQQNCLVNSEPQIISIVREIDAVDPLRFLEAFLTEDKPHFYFEKAQSKQAIVGWDAAVKLTINNGERFAKSQEFIDGWFRRTIIAGSESDLTAPAFCCSFTFFQDNYQSNSEHYYLRNYPNVDNYHSQPVFPAATLFLPSILLYQKGDRYSLLINTLVDKNSDIDAVTLSISAKIDTVNNLTNGSIPAEITNTLHPRTIWINPQVGDFHKSVSANLQLIDTGKLSKVVLSQAFDICSERPFRLINSLANLRSLYPDCYIFSTGNSQGQNFIGASPERLITVNQGNCSTDALAGSAPRGETETEDAEIAHRLLSSDKNLREHQAVVDFIIERLLHLGLTPSPSPKPRLMQLSNIQHLWTPITSPISPNIHLLDILAKLHPTPAAAGTPCEIAIAQIRQYETFDRSLYAAPLGWVDYHGNGEFIVGIRSALIDCDRARLFAGAGIVAGSEPEQELAEIQLKLQALLRALV
ncbi:MULTISPECIES: isochorismate synthase [Limnospira]|jgi:menaquinone-specific isochorismate synthase|uniref:isochorismate synthase n=1 Tax=Limnospira platensis NIES-46 TaxID=1236695 RepID=A0A5M3T8M9_LIMPL|nr:isochorismate synthase [Arthrospira platensis]KDR58477.1 isochorismate synthase [Arthrospira platensis str. Paraca]MDF2211054.1 isochorismate synthase [Arthrospira platensis NCB002]MDT9310302.1 isochorismate synthase [Limnospira sp. Paracas R14]BAI88899.1 isochorismate synthase [Arthrospira platensis NIES-39]BDT11306.1 isochorismate synthase [Arthrospira platensis NIES-39]